MDKLASMWLPKGLSMTLNTAKAGEHYTIAGCEASLKMRNKLEALGLVPGQTVNVISRTAAGLIVEVKNSRLAIGDDLARSLIVK